MMERWKLLTESLESEDPTDKFFKGFDKPPTVIDRNLILDSFYVTCSKQLRSLKAKEDIDYKEVDALYIDSQDILHIDHLWMLENLTILSLAHNYIEKIENLERLVNLVELNLSFNKIEIIEGLDTLTKLEIISLFNNRIQVLENIDFQTEMKILSVGNNLIDNPTCIAYLRRFTKLISLNMSNNPCTQADRFKESLAAYLPSLVYYDYELITEYDRKIGEELNKEELSALADLDKKNLAYLNRLKEFKERTNFLSNSYIDGLEADSLFCEMFRKDPDGKVFKDETDRFTDVYERLRLISSQVCLKISDAGADNYRTRLDEVEVFRQNSVENSENASRRITLAKTRVSSRLKNLMLRMRSYFKGPMTKQLKKDEKTLKLWLQGLKLVKEFADRFIENQWFYLMRVEMTTSEMNEETIKAYDRNLADIMNVFIEEAQGQFTLLRDAENDCLEEISNRLHKLMNDVYQTDAFDKLPPKLQEIMQDRESLSNAIASSHDCHTLVIDTKEDSIISRLKSWHRQQTGDLLQNETKRNRAVVLGIDKYIDLLKSEFEKRLGSILKFFQFLEPNENFEEDLDEIIKHWLKENLAIPEMLNSIQFKKEYSEEEEEGVPEELREVFSRPFLDDFFRKDWTYSNINVH